VKLFLGLLAALLTVLAISACSSGDKGGGTVTVTLSEYSITLDKTSLPEGDIRFDIKNTGKEQHEVRIIKTDLAPDQLPKKDDGSANLDAPDLDEVHNADEIDDNSDTSRTFSMAPGNYVLIDNTVKDDNSQKIAYYDKGMHAGFTVTKKGESPSATSGASASPTKSATPSGSASTTPTPTHS
jgi:hypothetical protein